jgi:hypothetical protein
MHQHVIKYEIYRSVATIHDLFLLKLSLDFQNSVTSPIIRFIIYEFTILLLVICINTS